MQHIIPFIARCLLSVIFILAGIDHCLHFNDTVADLAGKGIALPQVFAVVGAVFALLGGLLLVLGYYAKLGAVLLLTYIVCATLLFHMPITDASQQLALFKNMGLAGGLLMVIAHGAGGISFDAKMHKV